MKIIDAEPYDKVLEQREKALWEIDAPAVADAVGQCRKLLAKQPTVDAVEVVRCKECKSWEQYNACDGSKPHRCMNLNAIFHMRTAPDDFCSYGERRSDNG